MNHLSLERGVGVHPTAIIEPGAAIADDAVIGPYCHIGPEAVIGSGCYLHSHVAVHGRTTLGRSNRVWPFATLGGDPQDLKFKGESSELIIGDHNDIRECVTIHKGTANDEALTRVGDHNLIMAYAHIGHDTVIGDHCVIANAVQLAGHILIEDHVNVGGATAIHHFVTIGQYAYIGGMTRIVHDVPPFMSLEGNPARVRGLNSVGLKRHGFTDETERALRDAWKRLFKTTADRKPLQTHRACRELAKQHPDCWEVHRLIDFLRRMSQSKNGRWRERLRRDDRWTNPVR